MPRDVLEVENILDSFPTPLASRISCEPLDLSALQTRLNATIHIFRHAIHSFPGDTAAVVLRDIASSSTAEGAILIMDLMLPENGNLPPYQEAMQRMRDVVQIQLINGRTRDPSEWTLLLQQADERLKIVNASTPTGSDLSLLEIRVSNDC